MPSAHRGDARQGSPGDGAGGGQRGGRRNRSPLRNPRGRARSCGTCASLASWTTSPSSCFPGEVLGIAGLAGSGRTTLLKTLFGDIRPASGEMTLFGETYRPGRAVEAIERNVYLIPEERARYGLVLTTTITENTILSVMRRITRGFLVRMSAGRALTRRMMKVLGVRARSPSRSSESCPAATSRRSCWPRLWPPTRTCCCSTSPRSAWTSARHRT